MNHDQCPQNHAAPYEYNRQSETSSLCAELLLQRFLHQPKACIRVFGCQQNVSDGERIRGILSEMGFTFCDSEEDADLILFNTCAVREHAEDRVFGNVGALKHFKERRPDGIIVLCGCMMQQEHIAERIRAHYPYVNLVFGTHVIHRLPELMYQLLTGGKRVFDLSQDDEGITEGIPVVRDQKIKGWLPVMYGCNNFCTYCVVPYVRGRERSRTPEAVLSEARSLIQNGYKEITLLGQNVNSYGKTLETPISFAELLRRINALDGDFLIRFMTSHPKDCTEELLLAMRDCKKAARHLHLPVQSGSDRILREMNRGYTAEQYLSLVERARELMPDLSITSDIIVGFPGETREDFEQTLQLVERVQYTSLFTFIYSPRVGTPAALLPDPIPRSEKNRWFSELTALQESCAAKRTADMIGRQYRVYLEEYRPESGTLSGRTDGNVMIEVPGRKEQMGCFAQAVPEKAKNWTLIGHLVG